MNLVRSLVSITFLSLSGLAAAQSHTSPPARPPLATPHERAEVRHDRREIAHDHHVVLRSRHELRRAQRAHDFRHVREVRYNLHHERRELRHDRMERRHDRRELHRRY